MAEDPAEFFTMIFGGDAFVDWYAQSQFRARRFSRTNSLVGSVRFRL